LHILNDLAKQYLVSRLSQTRGQIQRAGKKDEAAFTSTPLDAEVPHAPFHPELSIIAVLSVYAGGSGVHPPSAAAELCLATEEGAGMAKALTVE